MHRGRGAGGAIRRTRALSEIVGTLMLVLIVVAAATAFSFFVASYESQLLAQETANHDRSLEAVNMLAVHTKPVKPGSTILGNLSLTFASADVNTMQIDDILIDGNVVVSYGLTYLSNGTNTEIGILAGEGNASFLLFSLHEVTVTFDLNNTTSLFSFLSSDEIPSASSYLVVEIQTVLGNDFRFTYVPPTPLADLTFVQSIVGGVITEIPVLDGTHSFQQGTNSTIVAWQWLVTNETTSRMWLASGAQFELTNLSASDSYAAVLTVYNSIGLFAVAPAIGVPG